jgi:hypothetical protein
MTKYFLVLIVYSFILFSNQKKKAQHYIQSLEKYHKIPLNHLYPDASSYGSTLSRFVYLLILY